MPTDFAIRGGLQSWDSRFARLLPAADRPEPQDGPSSGAVLAGATGWQDSVAWGVMHVVSF